MIRSSLANNYLSAGNVFPGLKEFFIPSSFINRIFRFAFTTIAFLICIINSTAQQTTDEQKQADYKKAITERSAKIVKTLDLNDTGIYNKAVLEISNQYFSLNTIHENFKAAVTVIKGQSTGKAAVDEAIKKEEEKKAEMLRQQHSAFLTHLKGLLTDAQIDKVKNGMTYNVLNVTYTAYLDMLLNLTTEQKEKIYNWLVEARELAMDEGSSDDKHKVFGKYKGRINNYLSAQGIDMKKEEKEWQSRIKERQNTQKQSS
jgi:Protein of unknown function (DUF3826)